MELGNFSTFGLSTRKCSITPLINFAYETGLKRNVAQLLYLVEQVLLMTGPYFSCSQEFMTKCRGVHSHSFLTSRRCFVSNYLTTIFLPFGVKKEAYHQI
jgi:hypothetical protein